MFDVVCGIIETRLAKCTIAKRQAVYRVYRNQIRARSAQPPVASRYESIDSLAGKEYSRHGTKRKKEDIFGGSLCVIGEPTPAISDLGERRVCR